MGHVLLFDNQAVMDIFRTAFAARYAPNTSLLKIKLTDGVLFAEGIRYDIQFGTITLKE